MVDPKPTLREIGGPYRSPGLSDGTTRHEAVLQFAISAAGVVDSASIKVVSTTSPLMTQYALRMLTGSRYWPGCRNGEAVPVRDLQQSFQYSSS